MRIFFDHPRLPSCPSSLSDFKGAFFFFFRFNSYSFIQVYWLCCDFSAAFLSSCASFPTAQVFSIIVSHPYQISVASFFVIQFIFLYWLCSGFRCSISLIMRFFYDGSSVLSHSLHLLIIEFVKCLLEVSFFILTLVHFRVPVSQFFSNKYE